MQNFRLVNFNNSKVVVLGKWNKGSCKQETSLTQLCDKIITICKR